MCRLTSIGDLSTSYPRPGHSLVMTRLILLTWARITGLAFYAGLWQGCSTEAWSSASPRKVSRLGLGRSLRLARLLDRDLVTRPTSQGCLAGTWLSVLSRKVARQRLLWALSGYPVSECPTCTNLEALWMASLVHLVWCQLFAYSQ